MKTNAPQRVPMPPTGPLGHWVTAYRAAARVDPILAAALYAGPPLRVDDDVRLVDGARDGRWDRSFMAMQSVLIEDLMAARTQGKAGPKGKPQARRALAITVYYEWRRTPGNSRKPKTDQRLL
jgi:hypothetical protein